MKWMIASDLHGSAYYCRKMLEAFEREGADRLFLLGDLLYHGPRNDLPREYAPKEVIPLLNGKREKLLCVRGNCDAEVDQMVLEFPVLADYAVLPVGQRLIYATHGHIYHVKNLPPLAPGEDVYKRQMLGCTGFLLFSMMRGGAGGGGIMNVGKAKVKDEHENKKTATFADVAGEDEEKEELKEVVEFLKSCLLYTSFLGVDISGNVAAIISS